MRCTEFSSRCSSRIEERDRWLGVLGLALLVLVGYAIYTLQQVQARGVFEYVGIDFRLFYASGQIAREHGLRGVYDPGLQAMYQKPLYEHFARFVEGVSLPFWALPLPYLPLFVAPFMLLPLLPPLPAFLLWVGVTAGGTLAYLYVWVRRLSFDWAASVAAVALFLSSANFLNLLFGQVNLLLLIAVGEALFNLQRGRAGRAGGWLALGWIKPQMILLLALAVAVVRRNRRFGAGFLAGSLGVAAASYALGGWESLREVLVSVQRWPALLRHSGMTWLSAVDHFVARGLPLGLALGIGILIVGVVLWAWWEILRAAGHREEAATWAEIFLITLATQAIAMPHGNVHMALALGIPWMVVLHQHSHEGVWWALGVAWTLWSGVILVLYGLCSAGYAHDVLGMLMLLIHVALLAFFYRTWRIQTVLQAPGS
ncbi:glycosyltransferase family 87 protein [uncultured Thermanaerothrix sp.]|uniref:glycosyltransferase family 87 protein n=1 Tax=uncultured Thermanaerothrix sp. TaxID=1195149 RepID=UPI0026166A3E|nr:glycosyltransferase family 87 protein [uncultured Thermanaerothrix sp.]